MRNVDGRDMWPLTPSPPTHTQTTCIRNRTRAPCERGIDLKRIYSRSDYTVLNSLSCRFQTYPLPGSLALEQKPERLEWRLPTLSSSPSCVIQTHDARMERWEGPVFHSRWLPGQPQAGRHRPQQWTEVGEGNKKNFIKPQAGLVAWLNIKQLSLKQFEYIQEQRNALSEGREAHSSFAVLLWEFWVCQLSRYPEQKYLLKQTNKRKSKALISKSNNRLDHYGLGCVIQNFIATIICRCFQVDL